MNTPLWSLDRRRFRFEVPSVRRLVRAITDRVLRAPAPPPSLEVVSTNDSGSGVVDADCTQSSDQLWRVQHGRRAVYRDLRDMDENDPIISTALDVIADCVTGYEDVAVDGFEWELREANDAALAVLDDLKGRLSLGAEAWQITRLGVRCGEEYREVVVDDQGLVVRFKSLPAYTIVPKTDEWGNVVPGWYQYPGLGYDAKRVEFDSWQIIDFVYGARRGYYGTGLMMSARRTWKRLQQIEDGMAIARQLRAYDKYVHRVPVRPEWDEHKCLRAVRVYKENMTKRKVLDSSGNERFVNNPLTVETDFYIPEDGTKRGGIDLVSASNVQLSHIADVEYQQKLLLARTKVPRKFLNLGRGEKGVLTDGSLTAEDIQFARTLRSYQAVLRQGYLRLGSFALFLQGYDARALGLSIRLAKISTTDALQDAKIALTWAQAAEILQKVLGSLPPELVMTHYMHLDEQEQGILRAFLEAAAAPAEGASDGEEPTAVGATATEVAQAFARLQVLIQAELERHGHASARRSLSEHVNGNRELILGVLDGAA